MTSDQKNEVSVEQSAAQKEQRRYFDTLFWGGLLVWVGLVFWADNVGFLPQIGSGQAWSWIFLGAGVYGFVLAVIRLASPSFSNPSSSDYIWAGIFLLIGLGGLTSFQISWPLILILVGAVILVGALLGRK